MSCKWLDICPMRRLEREGIIDISWREKYCKSKENWKNCDRYQMEERGERHSDYLLPDGSYVKHR